MKQFVIGLLAVFALLLGSVAFAVTGEGEHNPKIPAWGGDNTNWSNATGGSTDSNYVYNPVTYSWEMGASTGATGFTVEADIEMWMNMAFDATDIYFHIGRDPGVNPTMSQNVTGFMSSNNGQWLFVTKPGQLPAEADITKLKFKNNIFGGQSPNNQPPNPPCPDIPVAWFITDSDGNGEHPMEYSTGGNNSQLTGVTWLLDGGLAGNHPFTIRCQISPDRYQPDGHYEMDPILAASPTL